MSTTSRAWRLPAAAAISGALLGTAITASALGQSPAAASRPPASAATGVIKSYAPVVRQVVPSVVLIRTQGTLGSGVIFDGQGNIVTNAHVTGSADSFQIQLAGDPAPRSARLVGSYGPMIWPSSGPTTRTA
jgi:putative serine protease PepD